MLASISSGTWVRAELLLPFLRNSLIKNREVLFVMMYV
ncbi:hypothetical protein CTL2C_634 [Chlamydia trachomatis L2c]|nr:hypothetical protein CTL2C_634 [Chlamydia trachomatis L2c]